MSLTSINDQLLIPMSHMNTNSLTQMTRTRSSSSNNQELFPKWDVLRFQNICYRSKEKSGFPCCQKTFEKEILSDISGIMEPGLNAIMASKGRGKSLLLSILAARKDPSGLSGDVLLNEVPLPANFKCNTGYVFQGNAMMRTLTVRENLQFSAALRLPTTMTSDQKNGRINQVIEDLGLNKVADSKVNSREARKRTCIAMELITNPSILFLDEPTRGLDLSTATNIFLLLKSLSKKGLNIIVTIYWPWNSILKLFDSLTLLASGKLLFHGPAQEAEKYLETVGYPCGSHVQDINDGDISALVLNREEEDCEANKTQKLVHGQQSAMDTGSFYTSSSFCIEPEAKLSQLLECGRRCSAHEETTFATSFCHQLRWICWRSFKHELGFPWYWINQIISSVVLGLVVGGFFLGLKYKCQEIQYRAWTLYLLVTLQCFAGLSTRKIFIIENKFFIHESVSGYYRVSSYFLGKLLSDLLPRSLFPSILFSSVVYVIQGLKPEAQAFFITIFTLLLVFYSTSALALAMRTHEIMHTAEFLAIYILFMLVFFSMSVTFTTIPPMLLWLQHLSILYYGYMALQHNEFLGQNFCPELNTTESYGCSDYVTCTGEEFLTNQGIDLSAWGMWKNHLVLASILIIFLTITYLRLLLLKKAFRFPQ